MNKKLNKIIMFITILGLLFSIVVPNTLYAADDVIKIQFNDDVFYQKVLGQLQYYYGEFIDSYNDENKTIDMKQSSIDKVNYLNISYDSSQPIKDITGIEIFTGLTVLTISGGNINTGVSRDNSLNNIEPIRNLINLKSLYLYQNKIEDISPISNLVNLEILCIEGVPNLDTSNLNLLTNLQELTIMQCDVNDEGVKDIGKLTSLIQLRLGGSNFQGNNITNIDSLNKLTELKRLALDNNKIQDISVLANFENLQSLSLRGNDIEDLSVLKELNNITDLVLGRDCYNKGLPINSDQIKNILHLELYSLKASYCNLEDISELSKINTLTNLDLSGNNINDISVLNDLNNLNYVQLNQNNIQDFSVLSEECIQRLTNLSTKINYQKIKMTATAGDKIVLPSIFAMGFDEDSIGYVENCELVCYNCTLSEDKTYIVVNNNSDKATVTVTGGVNSNQGVRGSKLDITVNQIDVISPRLEVNYSTKEVTNGDVTVTITSNEAIKDIEGFTKSGNTLTKVYSENKEEEIEVFDVAGNKSIAKIKVANIDKISPQITVDYSTKEVTNGDVTVTITSNEAIKAVEGFTKSGNTLTKVYSENKEEEIEVYDLAGNKSIAKIKVANIDKTPQVPTEDETQATTDDEISTTTESTTDTSSITVKETVKEAIKETTQQTTLETTQIESANTTQNNISESPKTGDELNQVTILFFVVTIGTVTIICGKKKQKTSK